MCHPFKRFYEAGRQIAVAPILLMFTVPKEKAPPPSRQPMSDRPLEVKRQIAMTKEDNRWQDMPIYLTRRSMDISTPLVDRDGQEVFRSLSHNWVEQSSLWDKNSNHKTTGEIPTDP